MPRQSRNPVDNVVVMHSSSAAPIKRIRTTGTRGQEKRLSSSPFHIKFTCLHTGRYIASTKRKLSWHFGLLRDCATSPNDRQLHEIELVWSIKSGKTILFWNGQNITRLFPVPLQPPRAPPSVVEFTWNSSTGEKFELTARIAPVENMRQYDLLIDGVSFFNLPSLSWLCSEHRDPEPDHADDSVEASSSDGDLTTPEPSLSLPGEYFARNGDNLSREMQDSAASKQQQEHRIEAGGLDKKNMKKYTFDFGGMEDELRSDLYSTRLDLLRDEVAASIPETEEMMSKAIVNAFSEDHDSDTSHDSSSVDSSLDPFELEIWILAETFEWIQWSRQYISKYDIHDCKLEFMQKTIETIVSHVRHDRLSPHDASEIMLRVASVLKLHVSRELTRDTVVIVGLSGPTTTQDLLEAMRPFGEIASVAVCRKYEGYGMCRFTTPVSVELACNTSNCNTIEVLRHKAQIFDLLNTLIASDEKLGSVNHPSRPELTYSFEDDDDQHHDLDMIDPSDHAIETTYLQSRSRNFSRSMVGRFNS